MASIDFIVYYRRRLWLRVLYWPMLYVVWFAMRIRWIDSVQASRFLYQAWLHGSRWKIGKTGKWRKFDLSEYSWDVMQAG